jgi:hypothetical protein
MNINLSMKHFQLILIIILNNNYHQWISNKVNKLVIQIKFSKEILKNNLVFTNRTKNYQNIKIKI